MMKKLLLLAIFYLPGQSAFSQNDSLLNSLDDDAHRKEYVSGAFKSSRVVNNHSIEMIGKRVLDVRILHRFGFVNSGVNNLFGLDQARVRLGLDYGITKNLTIGFGRSTFQKDLDGFIKYRLIQQSTGYHSFPVSIIAIGGMVINTLPAVGNDIKKSFSDKAGYYSEIIVGKKITEKFSLQISPTWVHRNYVISSSVDDKNNVYAVGVGMRLKLSKRTAFVIDYDYVVYGLNKDIYSNPLAIGFDIETGGHVFQLHLSNSLGMNEKAFITQTVNKWSNGDINFGFNISRVFSIKKNGNK